MEPIVQARKFAEWALMERLKPGGDPERNARLKARIAGIRAHQMDNAPEVRSALLAIQASGRMPPDTG